MFDAAHIHVMIVHLPIMGTFLAMVPLLWWWYKKDASTKWIGLIVLAISLFAIPIATSSGEDAEHGFRRGTLSAQLDAGGLTALEIHSEAADVAATFWYIILALIALQLYLWKREYSWKNRLFIITLLGNTLLIFWLGYVGYLGGQIRHPEFRSAISISNTSSTVAE